MTIVVDWIWLILLLGTLVAGLIVEFMFLHTILTICHELRDQLDRE